MFAWAIMMRHAGDTLPSGSAISEMAKIQGGLGAGAAARTIADDPMLAAHAAGRTSWETIDTVDEFGHVTATGAEHIARNYVRLYQSEIYGALYRFDGDVERTIEWLTKHPDGKALLDDIASGQGRHAIPSERRRLGRATRKAQTEEEAAETAASLRINGMLRRSLLPRYSKPKRPLSQSQP